MCIRDRLKENQEQAIVLIPRRGYNGFLSCRNCGFIVNCPNCDVPLSVHVGSKGKKWLSCHWCDHKAKLSTLVQIVNQMPLSLLVLGLKGLLSF